MRALITSFVLGGAACAVSAVDKPTPTPTLTPCPYHAKDSDSAVKVLRQYHSKEGTSGRSCDFFSVAFDPSNEDSKLISAALVDSSVRSFYLAPEFVASDTSNVDSDSSSGDERVFDILDAAARNKHITTLGMWQSHFSDASIENVVRTLATSDSITSLSIENTQNLTDAGLLELAAAIGSSKLRTLNLKIPPQDPEGPGIDESLAALLTSALKTSNHMRSITIAPTNLIGDLSGGTGNLSTSLQALSEGLITNAGSLQSVDIAGVQAWGNDEINSILTSLVWRGAEHTLTRLSLSNTSIANEGAMAIASFLRGSGERAVLNTLELDHSNIGDIGVKKIALALKTQSRLPEKNQLRLLSLANAPISTDGAVSLLDAIRHNRVMREAGVQAAANAPGGAIPSSKEMGFGIESIVLRRTGQHIQTIGQEKDLPKIDSRLLREIRKECQRNQKDRIHSEEVQERHNGEIPSLELLSASPKRVAKDGGNSVRYDEM